MCIDGNNATHVSHYLNAQLTALWENAKECVAHYGDVVKLDDSQKYSLALAQFSVGRTKGVNSSEEHTFFASFGRPRLQFICNHDVVLHLTVERGYFDLQSIKVDSSIPLRERRVDFHEEVNVGFRLPFTTTGIRGRDHKIGSGEHFIQMVVLDFAKARLVSADVTGTTFDALSVYLRKYLDLLVRVGHHILFSLPEVDDARYRLPIDFSSISTDIKWDVEEVHGISLKKINNFLSSSWLKAAWLANSRDGLPSDRSKISISEYRSTWSTYSESDFHFHLKFNAPQLKALCGREAVLFFSVEDVLFSDVNDFSSSTAKLHYTNWEIALIVDVIHEVQSDGNVTILKIDLSNARFSQQFSTFHGIDETNEIVLAYVNRLIQFFSYEYLQILETAEFHILYHHDTRVTITLEYSETETDSYWASTSRDDEVTRGDTWWKEITTKTDMFKFDQIIAVSQESIEEHFRVLLRTYRELETWSYGTFFNATFGSITVRLLSNERAIIWVDVKDGRFKTLLDWVPWEGSEDHHISGWRLAFEVDLKIADRHEIKDLSEGFRTRFENSFAHKFEATYEESVLKHIYLDLRGATFIHELSTFDDASYGRSRLGIDKVQAVIHYVQDHFLRHLATSGHHIIYSIPVWKVDKNRPRHALTDVTFHVYSRQVVERGNWGRFSKFNQPILVILGVTNFHRLPSHHLQYTTNWLIRASEGVHYGTVSLSRNLFFEGHLLPLLTRINVATTVVPIHIGVEAGEWDLALTTWGGPGSRKKGLPTWVPIAISSNALAYKWDHRDEWTYEHDSSVRDGSKGAYFVSFHTCNQLSIPTVFKRGQLDINLHGETSLQLGYKGEHKQSSAKASAKWSITISAVSTGSGLSIHVGNQTSPTYERTHVQGEHSSIRQKDPQSLLRDVLPSEVKILEVISSLKESFEGVWQYCFPGLYAYDLANPVFTERGDILFELRPHGVWGASASNPAPTKAVNPRSPSFGPSRGLQGRAPSYTPRSPILANRLLDGISHAFNQGINGGAVSNGANGKPDVNFPENGSTGGGYQNEDEAHLTDPPIENI